MTDFFGTLSFHTHPDAARAYFLRSSTEGSNKKEIPISFIGSADTVNIAVVVNQMTRDLQAQVRLPEFRISRKMLNVISFGA